MTLSEEILDLTVFLAFDYGQMEMRVMAEVSNDALLLSQFQSGVDIHSVIGHTLTGWPVERIKKEKNLRKVVKNMVFGIIYGKKRNGLYDYIVAKIREIDGDHADLTGITQEMVERLYDKFFVTYTGVAAYMHRMPLEVTEKGYVETLFQFRREIWENDPDRATQWENQAINTPIQGTAHQFLLVALAILHRRPRTYAALVKIVMEIHDALAFFVKVRDLPMAHGQGMHLLQQGVLEYARHFFGITMRVPLIVEASAGFSMGVQVDYAGEPPAEFIAKWREKYDTVHKKAWEEFLK